MFGKVFRCFSAGFSKDYYKILGVNKTATKPEIRAAYLKLAKQYHPDAPTGSEEKFKELGEAWSVLGNESSKAEYDMGGKSNSRFSGSRYNSAGREYYSHSSDYQKWQNFYQQQYSKNSFNQDFEEFIKNAGERPKATRKRTEYYEFYDPNSGKRYFYSYSSTDSHSSKTNSQKRKIFEEVFQEARSQRMRKSSLEEESKFIDRLILFSFIFALLVCYSMFSRILTNFNPPTDYPTTSRDVWDDFEEDFRREFNKRR